MYDILFLRQSSQDARIEFEETDRSFVLGIPKEVLEAAKESGIKTQFFTDHHAPSFYGQPSMAYLESRSGVPDLQERLYEASVVVGQNVLTKIEQGLAAGTNVVTNGSKYGVSTIRTSPEAGHITIGLHDTDYFTHMVTNKVFNDLRKEDADVVADDELQSVFEGPQNRLGFFFNSIGLNASVVAGADYIVGTRASGELHVAMNEGLNKREGLMPDLYSWFARGMENELGVQDVDPANVGSPEIFMVPSVGQLGIHVVAILDDDLETLRVKHAKARDAWENEKLHAVPFTASQMRELADGDAPTIGYTRGIWDNLANGHHFRR